MGRDATDRVSFFYPAAAASWLLPS